MEQTFTTRGLTRGRPKRKRRPGAGGAVKVKRHVHSPRGPNRNKPRVIVDGYRRGAPPKRSRKKKR
jgi:hypothetical protein